MFESSVKFLGMYQKLLLPKSILENLDKKWLEELLEKKTTNDQLVTYTDNLQHKSIKIYINFCFVVGRVVDRDS